MNGVTLELEVTNTKALSKIRKKNIGIKIHFFCSLTKAIYSLKNSFMLKL